MLDSFLCLQLRVDLGRSSGCTASVLGDMNKGSKTHLRQPRDPQKGFWVYLY